MAEFREIACTLCPNGCSLQVEYSGRDVLNVEGALCRKGLRYAENEIRNPLRILTTTVRVTNGELPLVSVRSDRPIPREKLEAAVRYLHSIELEAPVGFHQTVCRGILGLEADILSTREIRAENQ